MKAVEVYTATGEHETFPSAADAARAFRISTGTVRKYAISGKQHMGYYWAYVDNAEHHRQVRAAEARREKAAKAQAVKNFKAAQNRQRAASDAVMLALGATKSWMK